MRKFDKIDARLGIMLAGGLLLIAAGFLVGCSSSGGISDGWLPATRDYAGQVAQDNAESAKTNPMSAILYGLGTLVSSIAGAGVLIRRFDAKPFEGEDGTRMTEGELVKIAQQAKAAPEAPSITGTDT